MLIRRAELEGGAIADVRIADGRVAAIGDLDARDREDVVEAHGGLLLPGLHDHHIHVAALAAALESVACGPPAVATIDDLACALQQPGSGWLRGTGYHESVAGLLDRDVLDALVADRPVRIQHRSGRMWFLNSAALDTLLAAAAPPAGLERIGGRATGRLFDADSWMRATLAGAPPSFAAVGTMLAAAGVTGVTEISPANDARIAAHFVAERARGALPQRVTLAGSLALAAADLAPGIALGPAKLHLHEAALPALDEAVAFVAAAHGQDRAVAVHCATEVELLYTLAMFDEAGARPGDRIEHAAVTPDFAIPEIARLGLAVVSQPHFIAERGDAYRRDVEPAVQPLLYRLRSFLEGGVTLAGGSDAPFGRVDPWAAMAAAVSRRTPDGGTIGAHEALTPRQALDLFLAAPDDLSRRRRVVPDAPADLCLLDRPWACLQDALSSDQVRMTVIAGRRVFDRVDQAPA